MIKAASRRKIKNKNQVMVKFKKEEKLTSMTLMLLILKEIRYINHS
jgi:hypothetical protein